MLGLPTTTDIKKIITKKKIYDLFASEITPTRRKSFDSDIGRITIINEISPQSVNLSATETVSGFFVVLIALKKKNFDPQNAAFIARLTGQKMILVLNYKEEIRLAVYRKQLYMGNWTDPDTVRLSLEGLDLQQAWSNAVRQVLNAPTWDTHADLEANLQQLKERQRVEQEITRLEKLAKKEKQPWKRFELAEQVRKLKETFHQ